MQAQLLKNLSQDKQNQNKDDYQKSSFQGYNGICGRY
jgi:hypothetical protein